MNRTINVTLHLSPAEEHELTLRAARAGLKLSPFIRREMLQGAKVSADTAVVLMELGRLRELVLRLADAGGVEASEIAAQVEAIDGRVFVVRATGVTA